MKNEYRGGNCLKTVGGGGEGGAWTLCRFNGGLARKRGMVFLRGCYPNEHYEFKPSCGNWSL